MKKFSIFLLQTFRWSANGLGDNKKLFPPNALRQPNENIRFTNVQRVEINSEGWFSFACTNQHFSIFFCIDKLVCRLLAAVNCPVKIKILTSCNSVLHISCLRVPIQRCQVWTYNNHNTICKWQSSTFASILFTKNRHYHENEDSWHQSSAPT